jgi:hypothetical protein
VAQELGCGLFSETGKHISRQARDIGQVSRGGKQLGTDSSLPRIQLPSGKCRGPSRSVKGRRGLETYVLIPLALVGPSQPTEMKGIPSW